MERRRMTTRSSRRSSNAPVTPVEQAVTANIVKAKGTAKRGSRKVLADKTNITPVAKSVPAKSPKKTPKVAAATAPIKSEDEVVTPCLLNSQSFELQPATPVEVRGEDLLRSLVHSSLTIFQTPNGPVSQGPEAETPQFGIPAALSPAQNTAKEQGEVAVDVGISSPSQQGEVVDARPPVEASPERAAPSLSERLSSTWVGCDVNEMPEIGEDDDSDCSVLVNVSSPGMNLMASPAPVTSFHPTTPRSADFKWQWRDQLQLKVKEQQGSETFIYYGGDEEYNDCDKFEGSVDYDGEVIDCEEICQAISRMGVVDTGLPEHKGRHIRFNYNSDDEIDVEEVDVMRLRGVPSPRGKHLRFPQEEEGHTAGADEEKAQ